MIPTIGRIVIAGVDPASNNGVDVCPAIITRVWGPASAPANGRGLVNLKLFNDSVNVQWKTSVILFDTEEEARAFGLLNACFWPPRA